MRDFQNCLQFSFKPRHSPAIPADVGQRKRRKKVCKLSCLCCNTKQKVDFLSITFQALTHNDNKEMLQALDSKEHCHETANLARVEREVSTIV